MEMMKRSQKTVKAASLELGISYRQAKWVYQRYLEGGDQALSHGNKGKPSYRRTAPEVIQRALALYVEKYADFGPTLAGEKLAERDGMAIKVSTLRRALIACGLWKPERHRREYRSEQEAGVGGG
jgi:hypothetical protein